jgi:integrase/recombinase XerD
MWVRLMERFFNDARTIARKRSSPLGPYLDRLAQHFAGSGYRRLYSRRQLMLVAEFGQWLERNKVPFAKIASEHIVGFLRLRYRSRARHFGDRAFFNPLRDVLIRDGVIIPANTAARSPVKRLIDEFTLYLQQERRLAAMTTDRYAAFAEDWLTERFGDGPANLSAVSAAEIVGYVRRRAPTIARKTAKLMVSALRSFLGYARFRGYIELDLAIGIPPVADWSRTSVPRGLPVQDVRRVLQHCNRRGSAGRRDYAILLLLARLGLRAREIAELTLDDIDWKKGLITVHGKGSVHQLPLPPDVGRAIATYLKSGRPCSQDRKIFLRAVAPVMPFKRSGSIGTVVSHALRRAKINSVHKGSHQFRHTLATEMLRRGASLGEIGELLRHRNVQTTTIYAKVDLAALRTLAVQWPGGGR